MMNRVAKIFFCCCIGVLALSCEKETKEVKCPVTYGTLVDPRDGNRYSTVSICSQTWMAQNLRFKINGAVLNPSNPGVEYGLLYTYGQVEKACPTGWHLPTNEDWETLETELGVPQEELTKEAWRGEKEGRFLKSTTEWAQHENGSNSSGFKALPAGFKEGNYEGLGTEAYFWTVLNNDQATIWGRALEGKQNKIKRFKANKSTYYSCRCIMD